MTVTVTIDELSQCYVTATYLDRFGNPYVPSAVSWRVDDLTNQVQVIGWTPIPSPTLSDTVTIPSASNAIANPRNATEQRQVAFHVTAPGGGGERYDKVTYDLLNIFGVP